MNRAEGRRNPPIPVGWWVMHEMAYALLMHKSPPAYRFVGQTPA